MREANRGKLTDMSIVDVSLISGNKHIDSRGIVSFFNDFKMSNVMRFYVVEHPNMNIVRAWQGHRHEQKWFYVVCGAFSVAVIKPDDWNEPSKDLKPNFFYLQASKPELLHIPGGYVTGFNSLEKNSKMIVYSDSTVEESQKDDYRFEMDTWFGGW